jgi:methyltransferase (TIGR00027 family)
LPGHVRFVPVVFGADRLDRKLVAHGYGPRLKTLFIIEGLLMYIPTPAVEALLTFVVKASGPGSAFVADYFEASVVAGTSLLPEAIALKAFVEQEGSALQFGFEEDGVAAYLKARGFAGVETISAAACKATYFPPTDPDRRVSSMFNFLTATV